MLKRFINNLKQNLFLKNILLVLSGTVLAQALGFITTPIITRLYLPYEFGVFSIFIAITGVLASFSSLRYEVAIPIERDDAKAHTLIKLSLIISLVITLGLIVFYSLAGNSLLSKFSSIQKIKGILWLVPLFFFLTALFRVFSAWSLRDKAFKLIAKIKVAQSLSSSFFKILLGFLGFGVVGLLSGNFCQETAGITGHVKKLRKSGFKFFSNTTWQNIKEVAYRYKKFPLYQTWSQLLLSIAQRLPIFFITYLFGLEIVGLYGFASSIISMPMNIIGNSVAQVYFSEISEAGKSNSPKLMSLTNYIIKKMIFVSLVPLIVILVFGPQLFSFVFGENWQMAGKIGQCLIIFITLRFITSPIMSYLNVLEKQQLQLKISSIRVLIIVVVFLTSIFLKLDVLNTILIYSISMSLFYLILLLYTIFLMKKIQPNNL